MKIFVKTYGCQMNERDSEAVTALLSRHGYAVADSEAQADVLLVNTCSVRGKAEAKALGKLGLLVAGKKKHPDRVVGAMGCMVQRLKETILDKVPGLDFAIGTNGLSQIPAVLERLKAGKGPVVVAGEEHESVETLTGHVEGDMSAFVNILLGCDRRCTYCVVPAVRGHEWSRPAAGIVEEVEALAAVGVKEVTLLGQSVMSYGRRDAVWPPDAASPRGYREPLPLLLEAVDAVPGIDRVRFTSGHPSGCSEELADAMADLPTVCEHLHLPVQSGSDRILSKMRRGYVSDDYREAVARLRRRMPRMALTTDIIVGFPTETEAEFEMTRAFMDEMAFDNAFIFKYSPRPETPAAEWQDDVPDDEKVRRNRILLEDQDRRGVAINRGFVGEHVEVLVEGVSLRNTERWAGRTRTNKITVFEPTPGLEAGQTVSVRVDRAMAQTLYGTLS